jgi:cysteine desulfurase
VSDGGGKCFGAIARRNRQAYGLEIEVPDVMRIDAQMRPRIYLDHNATTPLHPAARQAMLASFDVVGNPSSVHAEGRRARVVLDEARRAVAALVGCVPEAVVFTSGGTEALNIVLTPDLTLDGQRFDTLLIGAGEHPAVFAGHRFGDAVETVALDRHGRLDLAALAAALDRHVGRRVILALQAANNETGVIQPVRAAADLVHAAGGYVVCDAVQAVGKIAVDMAALGADALALSAHKFGGPKGVGALCFAEGRHHLREGVVRGGGQERGLRGGTENLSGIAGLGAACAPAAERVVAQSAQLAAWRDTIEEIVLASVPDDAVVFGRDAGRLPNTASFALPGYDAQVLLMNLDLAGIAVSAGSACAAGKAKASHVLAAMGVPADAARRAMRVSLGWTTTEEDIARFADAFAGAVRTMRPGSHRAWVAA